MSILLLEDYKIFNSIKNPDKDAKLQYIIDYSNDLIAKYCGTDFSSGTATDVHPTAVHSDFLVLPDAPIVQVTDITINSVSTDVSTMDINKDTGIVTPKFTDFSSLLNPYYYKFTYTYGYTEVPTSVILSAIELTTYMDKREFNKSRALGDGQSSDFGDKEQIPAYIKSALNQYKIK